MPFNEAFAATLAGKPQRLRHLFRRHYLVISDIGTVRMTVKLRWIGFHVNGQAAPLLGDYAKPPNRFLCNFGHCSGDGLASEFPGLRYPVRKVVLAISIPVAVIAQAVDAKSQGFANSRGCAHQNPGNASHHDVGVFLRFTCAS
ncbi:hypothetical protein D3C71_1545130 [compost metagenome]